MKPPDRLLGPHDRTATPVDLGSSKGVLEPVDRASEILFSLIMVLTITGSFSVVGAGRTTVQTMLLAALGCNFAWGVIDGMFYLLGCLADTARNIVVWDAVRASTDSEKAQRVIAGALPSALAAIAQPAELESLRLRLQALPDLPSRALLRKRDWLGALGVFLAVFLTTFPVVIPFIFMQDTWLAMRVSNGIALVLLFLTGYLLDRHIGRRPVSMGIAMIALGAALVGLTLALGG